jgi:hypothetical protein
MWLLIFITLLIFGMITNIFIYKKCSDHSLQAPFPLLQFDTWEFNNFIREKAKAEEHSWLKNYINFKTFFEYHCASAFCY